jgi:hypothetical protein
VFFPSKKRKTVGRSFRIDEAMLDVLNEEAEREGISVNSLLNRLLRQYSFIRFMLRFGAITLTRKGFSAIIESCPEEKVRENARYAGSTIVEDLFRTMGAPSSYSFLVYLIEKLLSGFAGWFECDHHVKPDREIFHLRHDLGTNWSIYIAELASEIFESTLNKEVKTEVIGNSVTMTIPK